MKTVYCANCGLSLQITRKALGNKIIDLVPQHTCLETPIGIDTLIIEKPSTPIIIKTPEIKGKFVQKIHDLNLPIKEEPSIKSTAPKSILNAVRQGADWEDD
jgi:hypothetical protein